MTDQRFAFVYEFMTLGGVEMVLRSRLRELHRLGAQAKAVFLDVYGGEGVFGDLDPDIVVLRGDAVADFLADFAPDWTLAIDTPTALPAVRSAVPGGRIAYEVHTTYPTALAPLLDRQALDGVAGIVVPSPSQGARVRRLVTRELPVAIAPNAIDWSFLEPAPDAQTPSRPVLLWVGRLDFQKNWTAFIQIATQVSQHVDVQVWMVGGEMSPQDQKDELARRVDAFGLGDRFLWRPRVNPSAMPGIYQSVGRSGGCLVGTSLAESFGLVALEAMASHCPVVAADVDGYRDLIENGRTGWLYPLWETDAASDRILALLQDPARSREVAEKAAHTARAFTPEASTRKLVAALEGWARPSGQGMTRSPAVGESASGTRALEASAFGGRGAEDLPGVSPELEERLRGNEVRLVLTTRALSAELAERDRTIRELQVELHGKVADANATIGALQAELHGKVGEANAIIADLRADVAERDRTVGALQAELHSKIGEANATITALQQELHDKVAEANEIIVGLRADVAERDRTVGALQAELHAKTAEANAIIANLQTEMHAKVGEANRVIGELQTALEERAATSEDDGGIGKGREVLNPPNVRG